MRKANRTWLYIAVLTFFTAVVWASVMASEAWRKQTVPADLKSAITEFDPNLDVGILDELGKRQ